MKFKSHIPNSLTLLNLFSGSLGVIYVLDGKIIWGAYFILLSAFFDFLDGFAARLLKVQGELGKQLDSLADMVSFGLLPGIILYAMASQTNLPEWTPFLTLLVPLFSALRLAKFNIDTRQGDQFIGLPTPASALFISTLPFLAIEWVRLGQVLTSGWVLIGISFAISFLLVAELPMIALKFKNFSFSDNVYRYLLIFIGAIGVIWMGLAGVPLVIFGYIVLSIIENGTKRE